LELTAKNPPIARSFQGLSECLTIALSSCRAPPARKFGLLQILPLSASAYERPTAIRIMALPQAFLSSQAQRGNHKTGAYDGYLRNENC